MLRVPCKVTPAKCSSSKRGGEGEQLEKAEGGGRVLCWFWLSGSQLGFVSNEAYRWGDIEQRGQPPCEEGERDVTMNRNPSSCDIHPPASLSLSLFLDPTNTPFSLSLSLRCRILSRTPPPPPPPPPPPAYKCNKPKRTTFFVRSTALSPPRPSLSHYFFFTFSFKALPTEGGGNICDEKSASSYLCRRFPRQFLYGAAPPLQPPPLRRSHPQAAIK